MGIDNSSSGDDHPSGSSSALSERHDIPRTAARYPRSTPRNDHNKTGRACSPIGLGAADDQGSTPYRRALDAKNDPTDDPMQAGQHAAADSETLMLLGNQPTHSSGRWRVRRIMTIHDEMLVKATSNIGLGTSTPRGDQASRRVTSQYLRGHLEPAARFSERNLEMCGPPRRTPPVSLRPSRATGLPQ